MRTEVIDISPVQAQYWLGKNKSNRPVRRNMVQKYAEDMVNGAWRVTHQGIAIDHSGAVLDGQHRLLAIVQAKVAVRMLVATECDGATFGVVDNGSVRSRADVLSLAGLPPKLSKIVSSATPWCATYQGGSAPQKQMSSVRGVQGNLNEWGLNFLQVNTGLVDSARFVATLPAVAKLLPDSLATFIHYQILRVGGNADTFLTEVCVDGATKNAITLELRRMLLANAIGSRKLEAKVIAKRLIVAYNRWKTGKVYADPSQILGRVYDTTPVESIA